MRRGKGSSSHGFIGFSISVPSDCRDEPRLPFSIVLSHTHRSDEARFLQVPPVFNTPCSAFAWGGGVLTAGRCPDDGVPTLPIPLLPVYLPSLESSLGGVWPFNALSVIGFPSILSKDGRLQVCPPTPL